jgi:SpoVK/Ycf46/Vps4 family AAA+-type ATPase
MYQNKESAFQILLYGTPGTGKTEYAKSIARSVGRSPRFVMYGAPDISRTGNRFWAVYLSEKIASDNDLLIVDEADDLLGTVNRFYQKETEKANLNTLLDSLKKPVIWIVNDISDIHPSILRRFAYSIMFEPLKTEQKKFLWKNMAKEYAYTISEKEVNKLAEQYNVNTAGIAHAIKISSLIPETSVEERNKTMNTVLMAQNLIINGNVKSDELSKPSGLFNPEFVNTDIPIDRIVNAITHYAKNAEDVCPFDKRSLCIMFYGIPGTGKSETARFLSQINDIGIIQKRYSDLVSKWVGESEKNISKAFKKAEESGKILFIDEADSLFIERTEAKNSWERSMTNEFLSQIESYKGILICCTNLLSHLDSAMFRRFSFKIEFQPVIKEKRVPLYLQYFSRYGELTDNDVDSIKKIESLTPGDLSAVSSSLMFESNVTHSKIIESVIREYRYKEKKGIKSIGFKI